MSGVLSLRVQGVPWRPHIWTDQLTLSCPGGTDHAHLITTGTPSNDPELSMYLRLDFKRPNLEGAVFTRSMLRILL
jgi:hypothetical protein